MEAQSAAALLDGALEGRYRSLYEQQTNPFTQFSLAEKQRKSVENGTTALNKGGGPLGPPRFSFICSFYSCPIWLPPFEKGTPS